MARSPQSSAIGRRRRSRSEEKEPDPQQWRRSWDCRSVCACERKIHGSRRRSPSFTPLRALLPLSLSPSLTSAPDDSLSQHRSFPTSLALSRAASITARLSEFFSYVAGWLGLGVGWNGKMVHVSVCAMQAHCMIVERRRESSETTGLFC